MANKKETGPVTAEELAQKQREISVSEFFLKNRHLLGFDNPRKALLTAVKEAVDNSLDACEEAGIVPEIEVRITQLAPARFRMSVTDNGPGIVRAQVPKIFAKLLYGSKFHRLRMSRGQQGIGISAAGMYGQLTTGSAIKILSRTQGSKLAHMIEVHMDTRKNSPTILKDEESDWKPEFQAVDETGKAAGKPVSYRHGTCVSIDMEASYVRGRLSVDEYLQQCAIVNPHLELHYSLTLLKKEAAKQPAAEGTNPAPTAPGSESSAVTYRRASNKLPDEPKEIKPHPHGVELGMLIQMLKDTKARTLRSALAQDFSRVSSGVALQICEKAGLNPQANPTRIAHQESEALFNAISQVKLMRPPTDCLVPIGETQLIAGLKKEVAADFYTAVTRAPAVYRGNPFQIEAAMAHAGKCPNPELGAEDPVTVMRFANRVPLLHMAGACAVSKAITSVNWKNYGVQQPRGSLPIGPMVIAVHIASVWVPFTSESKEAIAHYPEIISEIVLAVQECGRQLSVFLSRKRRKEEADRKRNYMALYVPHLALGLKEVLKLDDRQESTIIKKLNKMLEKTHLDA